MFAILLSVDRVGTEPERGKSDPKPRFHGCIGKCTFRQTDDGTPVSGPDALVERARQMKHCIETRSIGFLKFLHLVDPGDGSVPQLRIRITGPLISQPITKQRC